MQGVGVAGPGMLPEQEPQVHRVRELGGTAEAAVAGVERTGELTRGAVEKRISSRVGAGWGLIFPAVATATTGAWATAPLLAGPGQGGAAVDLAGLRAQMAEMAGTVRAIFERRIGVLGTGAGE